MATDDVTADADHLLYLADQGLAVIRLWVEIDGKPQRELCREQLTALCQRADVDRDGFLTDAEYQSGVVAHPAIQEAIARLGPKPETLTIGQEKLPLADVSRFLLHRVWTPMRVESSSPRMPRINQAGVMQDRPIADTQLFERLDADGNRKLTGRELDRAATVLGKLDFDEDEIISLEELRMQLAPNALPARNPNALGRRSDAYLSLLAPDRADAVIVRRILSLYDGMAKGTVKDQRLDRTEIRMAEPVFAQTDADGDGFWDFDELWRFLERPALSFEIQVRFYSEGGYDYVVAHHDPDAIQTRYEDATSIQFAVHGTHFQLKFPTSPIRSGTDTDVKRQFEILDGDRNDYLELKEFLPSQTDADEDRRQALFRQLDADGDEKVYLKEFQIDSQLGGPLRDSQLTLTVENLGRTLFGPLDLNGDGRLSQRELGQLKARLPEWDVDGDGKLVEAEIPQQYRLTLTIGNSGLNSISGDGNTPNPTMANGPLWFRKMDRNRDGEVTVKEFLGTLARFEKIDTSSDGSIDADEAARVK